MPRTAFIQLSENKQELQEAIATLKNTIKSYDRQLSISGWATIAAFAMIPASIATGNKMLGACAVSWIVSSFTAISASVTMKKRDEIASLLARHELFEQAKKASIETTYKEDASSTQEVSFGPIGLN